jgi:hypothetical protein
MNAAGGLGCQHAGNTHGIDQVSLDDLGLDQGCCHLQHGFIGKEYLSFGHGHHIPGESQCGQVREETPPEQSGLRQPFNLLVAELKTDQGIHHRLKSGGHKISPPGVGPDKKRKRGRVIQLPVEVSGRHGQLVKIGKQGAWKWGEAHRMVAPYNRSMRWRAWRWAVSSKSATPARGTMVR